MDDEKTLKLIADAAREVVALATGTKKVKRGQDLQNHFYEFLFVAIRATGMLQ